MKMWYTPSKISLNIATPGPGLGTTPGIRVCIIRNMIVYTCDQSGMS